MNDRFKFRVWDIEDKKYLKYIFWIGGDEECPLTEFKGE